MGATSHQAPTTTTYHNIAATALGFEDWKLQNGRNQMPRQVPKAASLTTDIKCRRRDEALRILALTLDCSSKSRGYDLAQDRNHCLSEGPGLALHRCSSSPVGQAGIHEHRSRAAN